MIIMPRKQRAKSNTGYYHVIARGNERKNILVDDQNKMYFIEKLKGELNLSLKKMTEIIGSNKDKINKMIK